MKRWIITLLFGAVMTTYNTGNAVGSTDPRDLSDNAGNFDRLSVGTEMEYPDRLGVPRKSWAGLEQQVADWLASQGWEAVTILYGAGVIVDRPTQLVERSGELYRVSLQSLLPLALSGDWSVDAPKLVAVGNQPLRDELAAPEGASLIGFGESNVSYELESLHNDVDEIAGEFQGVKANSAIAQQIFSSAQSPAVIDLHFGILNGTGWNASEAGGDELAAVSTTSMGLSGYDIGVSDPSIFFPGQLICYVASDNQYYSAVIFQKSGNVLRLDRTPEVPVSIGATVAPFYRDRDHPSRNGARCILDSSLRQLTGHKFSLTEYSGKGASIWKSLNSATLSPSTLSAYQNPGTLEMFGVGVKVSGIPAGSGAYSSPITLTGGDYETSVVVNAGLRTGGFDGLVDISIREETEEGQQYVIATRRVLGFGSPRAYVFTYSVRPRSKVSVLVMSAQSGYEFTVGSVQHRKVSGRLLNINRGKHVVLGDSWVADSSWLFYYMGQKLNKAQVINAGIGGNTSQQMIDRFYTDVAVHNPDFVWVMAGTNDYYGDDSADVPVSLFGQRIAQLRAFIQGIGAQPIFWTPSVGQNVVGKDRLPRSRAYALSVAYRGSEPGLGALHAYRSTQLDARSLAVPANGSAIVGIVAGQTRRPVTLRFAASSNASLTLSVGFSASPDGTSISEVTTMPMIAAVRDIVIPRAASPADNRFIVVQVNNPTSSAATTSVVADIAWSQSDD